MVFSEYTKGRILRLQQEGHGPRRIVALLAEEGIPVSVGGVWKFLRRYAHTQTTARKKGSGGKTKVTDTVKEVVETAMRKDDETTAAQLRVALSHEGHNLGLSTVYRCRTSLGWTYRGSAYCQIIRPANRIKRLEWARENLGADFSDVVFTDECSVQMETHRRYCCRKRGEPPKNKPRYKARTCQRL